MNYFLYRRRSSDAEDRQVLSLDSQQHEMLRRAAEWDIAIVAILTESRTAKKTGRPVFNQMLKRVRAGEADGIIAWGPDRLARNGKDAGEIMDMLDDGSLKDLKFGTFNFENTPLGKFMLGFFFAHAKFYVDSMAFEIKKGLREKASLGWRPTSPPIGYLTNPDDRTTIPDPERFDLVKRMWQLMLTSAYTPRAIADIAANQWGLRTRQRKRAGGKFLSVSNVYAMFGNVFYAGVFSFEGETRLGKHQPMVTLDEFDRVQRLLGRPGRPRPKHHQFAYTGLMRCGACGLSITAEEKTNRYGTHYTYYHCTRRKADSFCRQRYIGLPCLERAFFAELRNLTIATPVLDWLIPRLARSTATHERERAAKLRSLREAIDSHLSQLDALTSLRLRSLISDDEFITKRQELEHTRLSLLQQRDELTAKGDWIEPARVVIIFCSRAAELFDRGTDRTRRQILSTVGSNFTLTDRMVRFDAVKPFRRWTETPSDSELCSFLEDVRTFSNDHKAEFNDIVAKVETITKADEGEQQKAA